VSRKQPDNPIEEHKLAVVILAAGRGAWLKSRRPRPLHQVGGKPMLERVITAAREVVKPSEIFAVVGPQAEGVKKALAGTGAHFIEQTDHCYAIQCALPSVTNFRNLLVLSGHMPLIRAETIGRLWTEHEAHEASMTVLTAIRERPEGYCRILRREAKSAEVEAIIEQSELRPAEEPIREVSAGVFAMRTASLKAYLGGVRASSAEDGLSLTDLARCLHLAGEHIVAVQTDSTTEVSEANTLAELAVLDAEARMATARRLMAAGVTIFRPDTCVIDTGVEVEPDTIIEPFVQLLGNTKIGAETHIRSYAVIENCAVGNRVIIRQSCVLADSTIADGADIGPFARMRPGSEIGEDVHIGNFVEIKKSKLHTGVKAGHHAYLGDSEIGAKTNIGAGVIICNYDGMHKHFTQIGEEVFVGSDSTLVAPVSIEKGAYIGAGSCITKNVPAGALAVGRARQVIKDGWAAARRARNKERQNG
jgi:bifunctional UDP-N-acetylglucosamine pyrophosphorylase / glucosamine-1-phosphate N-acetyltransferase